MEISGQQNRQIARRMRKQFALRMVRHLRTTFPVQTSRVNDRVLTEFIDFETACAAKYGVTDEWDLQRYFEFAMMHGPRFDEDPSKPWAARILNQPGVPGTDKIDRLDSYDQFVLNRERG